MANLLVEKQNELQTKQAVLANIFEVAGTDIDLMLVETLEGDAKQRSEKVKSLNDELNDVSDEVTKLREVAKAATDTAARTKFLTDPQYPVGFHPNGDGDPDDRTKGQTKSLGQMIVEAPAFKDYAGGVGVVSKFGGQQVEMKTLFTTSAGWAPETTRTGRVVMDEQRPIQLLDLIPQYPTNQAAIVFMEETTFTNNAAEASEGATAGEAALALTERSSTVRKVATFLPVTDEQLEDVEGIEAYINGRLIFMLRQRLDGQVINGNGTAPNLRGILNVSGISTEAKDAADPVPSTIYKAITTARVTGRCLPNAVVMHSTDWQNVRLLQDANGNYIMGPPGMMVEPRLFGYRVVENEVIAQGTALTGDFANFVGLHDRRDVEVQISNSHGTFFVEGKKAIKADLRAALAVYRPSAFCQATGL